MIPPSREHSVLAPVDVVFVLQWNVKAAIAVFDWKVLHVEVSFVAVGIEYDVLGDILVRIEFEVLVIDEILVSEAPLLEECDDAEGDLLRLFILSIEGDGKSDGLRCVAHAHHDFTLLHTDGVGEHHQLVGGFEIVVNIRFKLHPPFLGEKHEAPDDDLDVLVVRPRVENHHHHAVTGDVVDVHVVFLLYIQAYDGGVGKSIK